MGPSVKITPNLILRVENELRADSVLKLYLDNKECFERFEPTRPDNFYTLNYHKNMMIREQKAYIMGTFLRYYIYEKSDLENIIGAINFNLMHDHISKYAEIGYKIDLNHQNHGYAKEACLYGISVMHDYYDIDRFYARIHPDNHPSRHVVSSLGFRFECVEYQSANILGKYTDLYRYYLDISDSQ